MMIRARFSRIASASIAITRCISCGISTSFISSNSTVTPQGARILKNVSLQEGIDLVSLFQNLVEIVLSDDIAQACQGHLLHSRAEVLDRENGFLGIVHPKPKNCVYLYRDAIPGDRFLLLNGVGDDAQIDTSLVFDPKWNQPEQSWSTQAVVATQPKYNRALVLTRNPKA
ncbi:MAG: hypothetical protein WA757_12240 [Candidatus Acidiferrales bacterium]